MSNSNNVPAQLFKPKSIVIVGASANREKLSNKPLINLLRLGFPDQVCVVNPGADEVEGVKSYPSVEAIPDVPELAFLVVPGQQALDAATACAKAGVKAAIVASTGFAEAGSEGVARQTALTALTREYGIRFVGPNTNGLYSAHDHLSLGYNAAHEESYEPGGVSIVSHSGALFHSIAENMRSQGLGLSKFVAVGNEADLDLLDFFEFMIDDETTRTILLVVEAVRCGKRFGDLADRARAAGKRVAALKLGVTNAGAASTAAHSSRMAGNARAYAALFTAAGVGMVGSIEALVAFARLAQTAPAGWSVAGRGLGLVTASGAGGTIMADLAVRNGLGIAKVSPETASGLTAFNADAAIFNPLDVASFGGSRSAQQTVPLLAADPAVDAVIAFGHRLQTLPQRRGFTLGLAESLRKTGKPHLVVSPGGLPLDQCALFESNGVPVFADCSSAIDGLSALFDACRLLDRPSGEMPVVSLEPGDASAVLNEYDSMAALDGSGIETVPRLLVDSAASAVAFAEKAGWPVVLKGVVDSIAHKSDVGLVRLNIDSAATLRTQFDELADAIHRATKGANGNAAICVQKMVSGGFEVIAGITREAPLGYFLLVGIGGRFAEQIDDVHLWAIPASERSIRDQLAATAVGRVLLGARWSRRQSFDELVAVLMNLQAMALKGADRLKAVEINPLSFGNGKPVALDALVVQTPA